MISMASLQNARVIWRGPKPPVSDETFLEIVTGLLAISLAKHPTAAGFLMRLKPLTVVVPAPEPNETLIQMAAIDITNVLVAPLNQELLNGLLAVAEQELSTGGNVQVLNLMA